MRAAESAIGDMRAHEQVCAERYKGIYDRLKRLEVWQWGIIAAALGGGPLVDKVLGLL